MTIRIYKLTNRIYKLKLAWNIFANATIHINQINKIIIKSCQLLCEYNRVNILIAWYTLQFSKLTSSIFQQLESKSNIIMYHSIKIFCKCSRYQYAWHMCAHHIVVAQCPEPNTDLKTCRAWGKGYIFMGLTLNCTVAYIPAYSQHNIWL